MAPPRCQFINCVNTSRTHSLFRFPASDENRLRIWIKNSGNIKLATLRPDQLRRRHVCEVHFESFYKNQNDQQKRLTGTAIPRPHRCEDESIEIINSVPVTCPMQDDSDGSEDSELRLTKPNKVYKNPFHTEEDAGDEDVEPSECQCVTCEKSIRGWRWWCLRCAGARCGRCAARAAHAQHFLLRAPGAATQEQTKAVITAILEHLQNENIFTGEEIRHAVDEGSMDLDAMEEPEMKAEPPEAGPDPLASEGCEYRSITHQSEGLFDCHNLPDQSERLDDSHRSPGPQFERTIVSLCSPDHKSAGLDVSLCSPDHKSTGDVVQCLTDHESECDDDFQCSPGHRSTGIEVSQCSPDHNSAGLDDSEYSPVHKSAGLEDFQCSPDHKSAGLEDFQCSPVHRSAFLNVSPNHTAEGLFDPLRSSDHQFDRCNGLSYSPERQSPGFDGSNCSPDYYKGCDDSRDSDHQQSSDAEDSEVHRPPRVKRPRVQIYPRHVEEDLDSTEQNGTMIERPRVQVYPTHTELKFTESAQKTNSNITHEKNYKDSPENNICHNITEISQIQVYSTHTELADNAQTDRSHDVENLTNSPEQISQNRTEIPPIKVYITPVEQTQKNGHYGTLIPRLQFNPSYVKPRIKRFKKKNAIKIQQSPAHDEEQSSMKTKQKPRVEVSSTEPIGIECTDSADNISLINYKPRIDLLTTLDFEITLTQKVLEYPSDIEELT